MKPMSLLHCSTDQTFKIWDARATLARPAVSVNAHTCDINVIAWNRLEQHLLASGADDGRFSVWDLRTVASNAATIASFQWFNYFILFIDWCLCRNLHIHIHIYIGVYKSSGNYFFILIFIKGIVMLLPQLNGIILTLLCMQ